MRFDEQVTMYEHVPEDKRTFVVTAAEQWSVGMINRLKKSRPEDVNIIAVNKDGSLVVELPFSWMRIVPKKVVTESQRETARQNIRSAHAASDGLDALRGE